MKPVACLAVCLLFILGLVAIPLQAASTPFNDVPTDARGYEALQSLAADGLLKGLPQNDLRSNRRLTRAQVAALIADALAKVVADGGAAKSDLIRLHRLMDEYKDELGSLGVRTTELEDRFAALDKTTQFAQRFSLHGSFSSSYSQREATVNPTLLGGAFARTDPVQRFTDAFIETDASNDPYYGGSLPGVLLPRTQWEFTARYAATPNLLLSLPVRIVDFGREGYRQQLGVGIAPTLEVTMPDMNRVKGLDIRLGQLENLRGSLTGLTYNPPDNAHPAFKDPFRPFPRGGDVSGTAFNHLDFQLFGYKIDPVAVNTGPFEAGTGVMSENYLGPYYFPQSTNVYGSAPTIDSFSSGSAPLQSISLTQNGQPGTMYVSYFMGPGCPAGCFFNGPNQPNEPSFSYVQTANQVVFTNPLPPGSKIAVSYQGFSAVGNTFPQRFDTGGRLVYHTPGLPNGTIGLTFNRIFDLSGDQTYFSGAAVPNSLVSDTVFGMDFSLPLAYSIGAVQAPTLFGEIASSKYTGDAQRVPRSSDGAGVIGLRFRLLGGDHTLAYQTVGSNFFDAAPFRYSGQAPALFGFWNLPQLPGPFGIGNDAALNQQVDAIALANGFSGPLLRANGAFPYGTFAFPLFNQFKAQGPYYYSSYAPNTRGTSVQLNFPLLIGKVDARLRVGGQALRELQPNSLATQIFGPHVSNVSGKYDQLSGGVTLGIPLLKRKATVNLDALFERLQRDDRTPFVYAADPALGLPAYNSMASTELAGSGATVPFYPNYVNLRHYYGSASVAVPISSALTANLAYVDQRYRGQALTTSAESVSQKKTSLTGGVLYNIPNTNASVNLFFNRYAYKDYLLPSYDWVQDRQNLYFTVKF